MWAKLDALDRKLGNQEAAVSVQPYESEFESQLQQDSGSAYAKEPEVEPEPASEPTDEMDLIAELKPRSPLPAGLFASVISRCATLCDERTSIWRRDLVTIMQATHVQANLTLLAMKIRELQQCAESLNVSQEELDEANVDKQRIAELIVAALQIEVTIKQQGTSQIAVHARCPAGGYHLLLREKVRLFERELAVVVAEQWKGCSATVMCVLDDHRVVPLSECQRAAARGTSTVDVEGSTVQLSDLGFDEHNRNISPPTSKAPPSLPTWGVEGEPEPEL